MGTKKGRIPWNKGKHNYLSLETLLEMSIERTGNTYSWIRGKKGIHLSPETEFKKGIIPWDSGLTKHTHKGLLRISNSKLREKNPLWKGDDIGYSGLHSWIKRNLGKSKLCEKCGTTEAKQFEWHNISGKYKRDLSDWMQVCRSCHVKIDGRIKNIKKMNIIVGCG